MKLAHLKWGYVFAALIFPVAIVFAAPDEEKLGRDKGYPRAPSLGVAGQDAYIVDSNSGGWESFINHARIQPGKAKELPAAQTSRDIKYQFSGQEFTIDNYLNRRRVTSLLIVKSGEIVLERYQYGRNKAHRFNSASMAKSFLSLLTGWAIEDGFIKSVDDPIEKYLPRVQGTDFSGIRIRDLLLMSSGLAFEEGNYANPNTLYAQMLGHQVRSGGLDALMELKGMGRKGAPGSIFFYSSFDSELLGQVISAATKKSLSQYLSEKLWIQIGSESYATWQVDAKRNERAHCCIGATARDYAKVGVLLANDGLHEGKQLIKKDWIDEITKVRAPYLEKVGIGLERPIYGYGYQTWIKSPNQFLFRGLRGQTLYVDRARKIVLVQTAVWGFGDPNNNAELEALWAGIIVSLEKP